MRQKYRWYDKSTEKVKKVQLSKLPRKQIRMSQKTLVLLHFVHNSSVFMVKLYIFGKPKFSPCSL